MMILRVKTPAGAITEIRVAELMEIDGKVYQPEAGTEALRDAIIHMEGRVDTLEKIVAGKVLTDG